MTAIQELHFTPGFRMFDGSDLNIIVDVLNGDAAGTFTGTFNGVVGGTTPAALTATTIHGTGAATFDSTMAVTGAITATGGVVGALNGAVGGVTPAAGTFTTVSASGNVGTSAYLNRSSATALTAAGTTRADALQLAKEINVVGTAAANTGVILPAGATAGVGARVVVFNDGANPIKVYGSGTDTIDGVAAATGVTLTNALRCEFMQVAAGAWKSAKLGATST